MSEQKAFLEKIHIKNFFEFAERYTSTEASDSTRRPQRKWKIKCP